MRLAKYLLISAAFFFQLKVAQAQQSIRGYYVDAEGTRRDAEFQFTFDQEDYGEFVVLGEEPKRVLTPGKVKEVGFENGRLFQSETLPDSPEPVFVLVMRDGSLDLLKWQKNYFIRQEDQVVALKELTSTKDVNGQATKVVTKQYQGVLMSLLKPSPDQEDLSKAIRSSGLNDRDLSRIVDMYHEANGLAIDRSAIEAQGRPFSAKIKVQAGVGIQSLMKNFENQGFSYQLESGMSPYVEAGVRFRDFRNAPRLFVDLGLAYYGESDRVLAEASRISYEFDGTQTFTSSSVVIPLEIHYIFSKGNTSEWYAGTGLSFWISSYENESAEFTLDNGEPTPATHQDDFVSRKPASVSPNLKLGWAKSLSSKSQLFVEAKGDLLLKNYEMRPLTYYAIYNLGVLSLSAGVAF